MATGNAEDEPLDPLVAELIEALARDAVRREATKARVSESDQRKR